MKYKIIDLFSGAGGLTLGFTDPKFCGGFECIFSVDNDSAAVKTHIANFGEHSICADIEAWLETKPYIPEADLVIGGPPCQGFSLLNKKRHGDERRSLWEPFMDVVEQSKAKIFVIENVDGLLKSPEFNKIQKRAKKSVLVSRLAYSIQQIMELRKPDAERLLLVGRKILSHIPYPFHLKTLILHQAQTTNYQIG